MSRDRNENESNNTEELDAFVSKVMSSIDQAAMPEPAPYFYSRVKARLERRHAQAQDQAWLRPIYQTKWSMAYLLVLIAMNCAVIFYSLSSSEIPVGQNGNMERLIDEYRLDYTSLYSYMED